MKKLYFLFFAFLYINVSKAQNVGIGTSAPNAALEVKSTTNGFLPPRLTIAQRDSITNPATGLIIFCIDCDELEVFNGIVWKNMSGTAACVSSTLPFIKICDQIWMPKNLDVSKYRNGENIPQVTDPSVWESLTIGAWCWYNNDSTTYAATYGKLYNWYAVNDARGLAPAGWHIPSDAEWTKLIDTCLGGSGIAGGKMKTIGTIQAGTGLWNSPNTAATNSSGFAGIPGTARINGTFNNIGDQGVWWSSTAYNTALAGYRFLYYNYANANGNTILKTYGLSVRCVRD